MTYEFKDDMNFGTRHRGVKRHRHDKQYIKKIFSL